MDAALSLSDLKLKVLYEISRVIGQALDLDSTLERILTVLSETLELKRGTVTLANPRTRRLAIRASHGLTAEEKRRGVYRLNEGVTGRVFRTAQPFVVPDIRREPLFLNKTGARSIEKGHVAFLGVPIVVMGAPVGVLSADRLFGNEVSLEEDVQFLTILGTLVAQLVSLNQQVQAREEGLVRQNESLKAEVSDRYQNFFMVGQSRPMLEAQQLIEKVAPTRATVLLLGESGTGKTLVARIIHELSSRAKFPFLKVNCAAVPENLLESELFGYEKGAFTGAAASKAGRFEEAEGGTIFLDEIGELPLGTQAKLLRFLQEKEFERVGGNRTLRVDVRIVSATNRDLLEEVRQGGFREDLYYRLNVFPIRVPALRERPEDIMPLANHFLGRLAREYGRRLEFAPDASNALLSYKWPGNVRELENLLERLAILTDTAAISGADLAPYFPSNPDSSSGHRTGTEQTHSLQELERSEVVAALERNRWNQTRAARELGITLRQIGYKVRKFGLESTVTERRARFGSF
ncbi:MAG: sigma 54-interacting transcriptional regulator [Deltaproteobacteria bacterium]|nr:sigma 54-interacting transcriptional regulator [Deltaproteobacteria bacterium]